MHSARPCSMFQRMVAFNWSPQASRTGPRLVSNSHARRIRNASSAPRRSGIAGSTTAPSPANTRAAASTAATILGSIGSAPPKSAPSAMRSVPGSGTRTARTSSPASASDTGTRGSGPAMTDSSSATSSTLRPIGPSTPRSCHGLSVGHGSAPARARPQPDHVAERRRVAQRTADVAAVGDRPPSRWPARPRRRRCCRPPERVGSYGLRVVPNTGLNVCEPAPNSGVFVLPSAIAPAARSRAMTARRRPARGRRRSASPSWCGCPPSACVVLVQRSARRAAAGSAAPDARRRSAASAARARLARRRA